MATTAYSQHYAREIDVEQLAWLLSGRQPIAAEQVPEIDPKWSDWIRSDVRCSSCGSTGAHVVRSARARATQKLIRQSHFRFVGQDGNDAHHPFCEFYGEDDGVLAFDGVKGSTWQPRFYQTCAILLTSMGVTLPEFVGEDEAEVAKKLIDAADDESAKAVKGDVEAHKKVWNAKLDDDRSTLQTQAAVWATRQNGHRVDCPSCGSAALVLGEPVSAPTQKLDDDEIIETQEYLPTHFECVACGLKIAGLSRLAVVGLSDRYKKTQTYDAAEYYAPADDWSNYEDDNNER